MHTATPPIMTSGSSTPTRSCLKRRLQAAKNSITGASASASSSASTSSRNSLCKTVSFDGKDNVFFADPDYDRHSVPVAPKLSYEDLLELKMLNVNMMCPQNRCGSVVPVGIMPLLGPSESPSLSPSPSPSPSPNSSRPKQIPSTVHHHHTCGRNSNLSTHNFVGMDDDLASMSSITPPPSSPSEHSPNMAPRLMIATDEEGQLIFQFSEPDEDPHHHQVVHEEATHSLAFASDLRNRRQEKEQHGNNGLPSAVALSEKLSTIASEDGEDDDDEVTPPFPVLPTRSTLSHSPAALTLTPSFFTLPPPSSSSSSSSDASPSNDSPSSPFPFAPPVPTTTGLTIQPASAMTLSDSYAGQNKPVEDSSVHATNTTSPLNHHHRSTSSSSSSITPTTSKPSPISPLSTPHASPTLRMRPSSNNASASQNGVPPVAGPLAALQLQHQPHSPQLSGVPSPSLVPPSPLSLYPPSLDLNTNTSTTPTGFFPERKKGMTGHVKRPSGSALARPTSPVVNPLKS